MFMLNSNYCDIATISGVSRYSGGSLYHYPNFHYDPEVHGPPSVSSESGDAGNVQPDCKHQQKKVAPHELCDYVEVESLRKDFQRYLTRKIGFEAVLRVRCSRGVTVQVIISFEGLFTLSFWCIFITSLSMHYCLLYEWNDEVNRAMQS